MVTRSSVSIETDAESSAVTAAPVGPLAVARTVKSTEPASTSDWVSVYAVTVQSTALPGARAPVGHETTRASASRTVAWTDESVTLPVLRTRTDRSTPSPATGTRPAASTEGSTWTSSAGAWTAVTTVTVCSSETGSPDEEVPLMPAVNANRSPVDVGLCHRVGAADRASTDAPGARAPPGRTPGTGIPRAT